MATGHLEVERKFEAEPSFAVPDLGAVARVASVDGPDRQDLEATYYDTADLRLLRNRVTLRRRTGGRDAGWHLKLPSSGGARRELQQPLGRATRSAPKAVVVPVLGLLGTARTAPVATIRTHRMVHRLLAEDGRVLAEVADDAVEGFALPADPGGAATVTSWREIEVELVDGDEELLDAVSAPLLAAGARESSEASKLGRVLRDRLPARAEPRQAGTTTGKGRQGRKQVVAAADVVLGAVAAQLAALRAADLAIRTDRPEGVHDLRVACRRLRSILAAFRPVLERGHTDAIRDELRWIAGELSSARDGEVALEHLRALVADQPAELVLGPVAARLQQTWVQDREAGVGRAARALADRRYLRLLDALEALLADPPLAGQAAAPAPDVLTAALARSAKRLRRAVRAAKVAEEPLRAAALHEVRKAAKRVRYTAEVAEEHLGGPATTLVGQMEQVQDVLGEAQDTVVTREHALRLGVVTYGAGENAWTYGRLHALEEARAVRAEAAFRALLPDLRKAVRRAIRRA